MSASFFLSLAKATVGAVYVAKPFRMVDYGIRPEKYGVPYLIFHSVQGYGRRIAHGNASFIRKIFCKIRKGDSGLHGIEYLDIAVQACYAVVPVINQGIGPKFLVGGHDIALPVEMESIGRPVKIAGFGSKDILFLPCRSSLSEEDPVAFGIVAQFVGLYKDGICKHLHIVVKVKSLLVGDIPAVEALYEIPVCAAHGSAVIIYGNAVFCVVIKVVRAQDIPVFVEKLYKVPSELGQILLHEVINLVACEKTYFPG